MVFRNYLKMQILILVMIISYPFFVDAQGIAINPASSGNRLQGAVYVSNEVLIKFKPTVSAQMKSFVIQQVAAINLGSITDKGLTRVQLAEDQSIENAISTFSQLDSVEYAQPNFIYRALAVVPNDTNFSSLWGLNNTGQTISGGTYTTNNPGTSGKDMNLKNAWEHITDCSNVIVAVIDTGINYNQQDLVNNMWDGGTSYPNHGYDFVDSDNDPMDLTGHGTHVAGTIGAVGNNGTGSTGVCWKVQLMAIRTLGTAGGTTADIVSGIDFAVTNGADVINMSLGNSEYDQAFYDALTDAKSGGVVVVVAAGNETNDNDGSTASYPCNYTHNNIVCVAALDQSYELASFSNWGATSVDVGAPGTNIYSTWPGTHTEITDNLSAWTNAGGGGWAAGYKNPPGADMLYNPSNWPSGYYANSEISRMYKNFTISSSADAVVVDQYVYIDVLSGDYFFLLCDEDPGWGSLTVVTYATNYTTGGYPIQISYDLNDCIGQTNCGIGYQLETNASIGYYGVGIMAFSLTTLELNTNSYHVIDGTSMASPHVAGLVAMIKAFNPRYSYQDIIESIKNGGDAVSDLVGNSTTGKAVHAYGSLQYIKKPTGLVAVQQ